MAQFQTEKTTKGHCHFDNCCFSFQKKPPQEPFLSSLILSRALHYLPVMHIYIYIYTRLLYLPGDDAVYYIYIPGVRGGTGDTYKSVCLLALRGRVLRGSPMEILLIFCIGPTKRSRLSGVRSYSGRNLHSDATFRPAQTDEKRERGRKKTICFEKC